MTDAVAAAYELPADAPGGFAAELPELGPADPVEIAPAPAALELERGWLTALLPAVSALGMLTFAVLSPSVVVFALTGTVAALSVAIALATSGHQRRRRLRQWAARRDRYRAHLAASSVLLDEAAVRQVRHAGAAHPEPASMVAAARVDAGWLLGRADRGVSGSNLTVRLGLGRSRPHRPALHRSAADAEGDSQLQAEAARVTARFCAVDGVPVTTTLAPGSVLILSGARIALLRAMVVSLACGHSPSRLCIDALVAPAETGWLSRLPHAGCITADPAVLRKAIATRADRAGDASDTPAHLVVVAADDSSAREVLGVLGPRLRDPSSGLRAVAVLREPHGIPPESTAVVAGDADGGVSLTSLSAEHARLTVPQPDAISYSQAFTVATALSEHCSGSTGGRQRSESFEALLFAEPEHPLALPIGHDLDGGPVRVDLREAAHGGDGPHGLIIGATGSGKSELLRTLLIGAAFRSTPEQLELVLVDYKGGAAFADLARLPHTCGLLTNLSADPQAVDRLCASLRAELIRRQGLLRMAGADHIDGYRALRDAGGPGNADRAPLARLLVVIDEYAELIEESPEVVDVLTSIGRLGRSLGVHLLLASQRLDDGRLRGLEAHLRFRVCLRTLAPSESLAVIGSPLAAALPAEPGHAYLRRDGTLTRLRVARVTASAAAESLVPHAARSDRPDAAFHRRAVLLPPLPETLTLRDLGRLTAPFQAAVGLLDAPAQGEQRALVLDFGEPGHVAIAGAPRSGRSTALASVVVALADATPPGQLAVHVIASASSPLASVAGLPHVGTVASTPEHVRQVLRTLAAEVAARHAAGMLVESAGRVLVVVDDAGSRLRADDELLAPLLAIAADGPGVGVCLVVTCARWVELRSGLREAFGTCWELRLGDPADSLRPALHRRVPRPGAGRLLTDEGYWAQLALPCMKRPVDRQHVAAGLAHLVARIARRGGPPTRPIQPLPQRVAATALLPPSTPQTVSIGVTGSYAEGVEIPLTAADHLLVLGNAGSGKSAFLRLIAAQLGPGSTRSWLVDPRGRLSHLAPSCHRYAAAPGDVAQLLAELADALGAAHRFPSAATAAPAAQPAREVLLIDDLELVGKGGLSSPFGGLVDILPRSADVGLAIVAARRISGSSRAAFDPFFGSLLELCETGVLLSGDPAEGPVLGGLRPRPRPPGRGDLVRRGLPAGEIQVAWLDPNGELRTQKSQPNDAV